MNKVGNLKKARNAFREDIKTDPDYRKYKKNAEGYGTVRADIRTKFDMYTKPSAELIREYLKIGK